MKQSDDLSYAMSDEIIKQIWKKVKFQMAHLRVLPWKNRVPMSRYDDT